MAGTGSRWWTSSRRSHKTLEHLSLDCCSICSSMHIPDPLKKKLQFSQSSKLSMLVKLNPKAIWPNESERWVFANDIRWSDYFERIASELPNLKRLQFGKTRGPWIHVRALRLSKVSKILFDLNVRATNIDTQEQRYWLFGWRGTRKSELRGSALHGSATRHHSISR